ncbi:zinc metallopeptidase [Jonquetella anthropi]|uniref:zinc metallopeptidase n=1 Tax=Jonquetella anthropi TaxID=428712 RepID=UPI0001B90FCC|nr:zinc metallopeptidase [Jonquetella anthropi]EEX49043.1 putative neutral zinc metallopeptidase [Jonquetella anthropi E3_33 E1]
MMMPYLDPTFLLIVPALLLALWAQTKTQRTFAAYSQVTSQNGYSAQQVARSLLDRFGLSSVPIRPVPGSLTDHYDPQDKSLSLSQPVYDSHSIAAIGVAAHEVGHAIQHEQEYRPLAIRNAIVPAANIGSQAALPLFFIGLLMRGQTLMTLGIVLYLGVLAFHLVTLPVEIDASRRALRLLDETGMLSRPELLGAKKVLSAAALTYVAATLMSLTQLVRLLILRGATRNRD